MPQIKKITVKDFNNILTLLKKIKRMGNSFIICNDTIVITDIVDKLVGKHFVQNDILDLNQCYRCTNVVELVEQFESIKGKKTELYYTTSDTELTISVNGTTIKIGNSYDEDELEVLEMSSLVDDTRWINVAMSELEKMKSNQYITLSYDKFSVRVSKSLFQELGTSRVIKHKIRYYFEEVKGYPDLSIILIEVTVDDIRIIHRYTCVNIME